VVAASQSRDDVAGASLEAGDLNCGRGNLQRRRRSVPSKAARSRRSPHGRRSRHRKLEKIWAVRVESRRRFERDEVSEGRASLEDLHDNIGGTCWKASKRFGKRTPSVVHAAFAVSQAKRINSACRYFVAKALVLTRSSRTDRVGSDAETNLRGGILRGVGFHRGDLPQSTASAIHFKWDLASSRSYKTEL